MPPKTSGKAAAKSGKATKAIAKGDKKKSVITAISVVITAISFGVITAISTFTAKDATSGSYFVGFLILCISVGFVVAAGADFFMLTKVPECGKF